MGKISKSKKAEVKNLLIPYTEYNWFWKVVP